jgi:hypothetical protein
MRALGLMLAGVVSPMLLFFAVASAMEVPWQVIGLSMLAVMGAACLGLAAWWLGARKR